MSTVDDALARAEELLGSLNANARSSSASHRPRRWTATQPST